MCKPTSLRVHGFYCSLRGCVGSRALCRAFGIMNVVYNGMRNWSLICTRDKIQSSLFVCKFLSVVSFVFSVFYIFAVVVNVKVYKNT